jgi:hypothetical protein
LVVELGEPRFDKALEAPERSRPEHNAPQDEERCSDRARQQDPADAGDEQEDADLPGHCPDPPDFFDIVDRIDGARRHVVWLLLRRDGMPPLQVIKQSTDLLHASLMKTRIPAPEPIF